MMSIDRKNFGSVMAVIACLLFLPTAVLAETATFDSFSEGIAGSQVVDGGITFFGLDNGQPGLDNIFIIEHAEATLTSAEFSAPNGLTATSYSPGAEVGYGPVKEMSMTTGSDADSATIQVFTAATQLNYYNTLTLEALKDGEVVGSVSQLVNDIPDNQFTLSISGVVFDTLRLVSSPNSQAFLIDNVTIESSRSCDCDLNQDTVCDLNDWALFRTDWGRTDCAGAAEPCECDLNQDGRCDLADWQLFRENWGSLDCE